MLITLARCPPRGNRMGLYSLPVTHPDDTVTVTEQLTTTLNPMLKVFRRQLSNRWHDGPLDPWTESYSHS
jgi:hypothetical protein